MNDCLVTKLKVEVNNSDLEVLGYVKMVSPATQPNTSISVIVNTSDTNGADLEIISGNGTFEYQGTNYGASLHVPRLGGRFNIIHNDANPVIFTANKLGMIYEIAKVFTDLDKLFLYNPAMVKVEVSTDYSNLEGIMKLTDLSNIPVSMQIFNLYRSATGYLKRGTVSDLARLTSVSQIVIEGDTNNKVITGNIADFAPCIDSSYLNLMGHDIQGTLESLGAAMVAQGRTSGRLMLRLMGNNVTVDGHDVAYTEYLRFGSSMSNPTQQEIEQGYQISIS